MAYYKNRIKRELKTFSFSSNTYTISSEINAQYQHIKSLLHTATRILSEHNTNKSYDLDKLDLGINTIITFYDACGAFMIILLDEIFKEPLENKKDLFLLVNKTFKIFFIFDVTKHRYPNFFSDFARYRESIDSKINSRFAILATLAMPMAHCFASYFSSEYIEIHAPSELIRRNSMYLDEKKKEHLYKIACISCKYDYQYCRVFFAGLFNRFFHSGYFVQFIDSLNKQKGAYYVAIAEYH